MKTKYLFLNRIRVSTMALFCAVVMSACGKPSPYTTTGAMNWNQPGVQNPWVNNTQTPNNPAIVPIGTGPSGNGPGLDPYDPCGACWPCVQVRRRCCPADGGGGGSGHRRFGNRDRSGGADERGADERHQEEPVKNDKPSDPTGVDDTQKPGASLEAPHEYELTYEDYRLANGLMYSLKISPAGNAIEINDVFATGRIANPQLLIPRTHPLFPRVKALLDGQVEVQGDPNDAQSYQERLTVRDLTNDKVVQVISQPRILGPSGDTALFDDIRDYIWDHLNPADFAGGGTGGDAEGTNPGTGNPETRPTKPPVVVAPEVVTQPVPETPEDQRDAANDALNRADVTFQTPAIYFDTGKSTIKKDKMKAPPGSSVGEISALERVQRTALVFAEFQNEIQRITIIGQTDKEGDEKGNFKLSLKRAQAVRTVIVDPKLFKEPPRLNEKIVFALGVGEPKNSSCKTEKCPQDRKVSFSVDFVNTLDPNTLAARIEALNQEMIKIWGEGIRAPQNGNPLTN